MYKEKYLFETENNVSRLIDIAISQFFGNVLIFIILLNFITAVTL